MHTCSACPIRRAVALPLLLALAACGATNEEFARFAGAGVTFSDSLPSTYTYYLNHQAERRLSALEINRSGRIRDGQALDASLAGSLDATVAGLKRTSALLQKAEEHATVLRSYFAALAGLAADTESQAIGNKAAGLAQRIATLSGNLVPNLAGVAIRQFSTLAVGAYRNEQLRKHIEQHYVTIGNAIVLQRTVLEVMRDAEASDWISDEQARVANIQRDVRAAFLDPQRQLPLDWRQRLLTEPRTTVPESPLSQGIVAAEQLEQTFVRIVEGKPGALAQLEQSVDFLDKIAGSFRLLQK